MDLTYEKSNKIRTKDRYAKSPYINVIYPTTESFEPPLNLIITWESGYFNNFYFPNVKIDLYKSGIYNSTIVSNTNNNGFYNWITESLSGGTYTIKISVVNLEIIYGFSSPFTIISSEINPWILTNWNYGGTIPYTDKEWILTNYKYPENTKDSNTNGTLLTNFSYPINDKDSNENAWLLLTDGV